MFRVFGRTAAVVLGVFSCLGLLACEDKPKEFKSQFRPSMATSPAPSRPIAPLPPTAQRKPVDMERYKDAKAPVVPLVPGKSICRECEMSRRKAKIRNSKRLLRTRPKKPLKPKSGWKRSGIRLKTGKSDVTGN